MIHLAMVLVVVPCRSHFTIALGFRAEHQTWRNAILFLHHNRRQCLGCISIALGH